MKEHQPFFHSRVNMNEMKNEYSLRCKQCGSIIFAYTAVQDHIEVDAIRDKLNREWKKSIIQDCDEVKLVNEIARVQES